MFVRVDLEKFLQKLVGDRLVSNLQDLVRLFSGPLTDEKLCRRALQDFHQSLGIVDVAVTDVVDKLKKI